MVGAAEQATVGATEQAAGGASEEATVEANGEATGRATVEATEEATEDEEEEWTMFDSFVRLRVEDEKYVGLSGVVQSQNPFACKKDRTTALRSE